jgi:hypothetical protein
MWFPNIEFVRFSWRHLVAAKRSTSKLSKPVLHLNIFQAQEAGKVKI